MAQKKVYLSEKKDYNYAELQIYFNNENELYVKLDDGDGYAKFTALPIDDAKDIVKDLIEEIKRIETCKS